MQHFTQIQHRLQRTIPQARIEAVSLPGITNMCLGLINEDFPTGPLDGDTMHAIIAEPAYWAFCWGSGLATAQWLFEQPQTVQGLKIGDLGCGSGVVGIAAKLAGAAQVWCCDNDEDALAATVANAQANGADIHTTADIKLLPDKLDVLFLADVLYDRSNFALIEKAKLKAKTLIIADSRVTDVEDPSFTVTHRRQALTFPNLGEFDEFKNVQFFVWHNAHTL